MSEVEAQKSRRPLVERHPELDIRQLRKAKAGEPVRVEWRLESGALNMSAFIEVELDTIAVWWHHDDGIEDHVLLTHGFERPDIGEPRETWFWCPSCEEKVRKLSMYLGKWKCRSCHRLVYSSQYVSAYDKTLSQLRLTRLKVNGGRPKHQRIEVYERNLARIHELESRLSGMKPKPTHRDVSRVRLHAEYLLDEA